MIRNMTSLESASAARTPSIEQLPGGMRVLLAPSAVNDIVAVVSFMPLPGAIERPHEAGLVTFMHRMLRRGTTSKTNVELAEAIDSLGIELASEASDDFSHAHLICTKDTFREGLALMAEVLQHPSFEPEEVEKERQSILAAIRRQEDDKLSATLKRFMRELYGDHGYGLPHLGLRETVGEFTREQLVHVHEEFVNPARFLTVIMGNFDPAEARDLLTELFQPAPGAESSPFVIPPPPERPPSRVRLSRDCEQAYLVLGMRACPLGAPDWPAVRVLNTVLGEGMSSRLFVRLRDEQGLAYATGSAYGPLGRAGHLFGYIGTKPESLDTAREGMLEQFELLKSELVPREELQRSKNYLVGKFLIDHQTNYRRAFYLGFYETMGLGITMDENYPKLIQSVTAEQVREAANRYLHDPTIVELVPEESGR